MLFYCAYFDLVCPVKDLWIVIHLEIPQDVNHRFSISLIFFVTTLPKVYVEHTCCSCDGVYT